LAPPAMSCGKPKSVAPVSASNRNKTKGPLLSLGLFNFSHSGLLDHRMNALARKRLTMQNENCKLEEAREYHRPATCRAICNAFFIFQFLTLRAAPNLRLPA